MKKLLCLLMLLGLSACASQPDWLQRKRLYPDWEVSSRTVNSYSFNWTMQGDEEIMPIQVFNTHDETWIQLAPHASVPSIFTVHGESDQMPISGQEGYQQKVIRQYHLNPPYVVLKGVERHLLLQLGRYKVWLLKQD